MGYIYSRTLPGQEPPKPPPKKRGRGAKTPNTTTPRKTTPKPAKPKATNPIPLPTAPMQASTMPHTRPTTYNPHTTVATPTLTPTILKPSVPVLNPNSAIVPLYVPGKAPIAPPQEVIVNKPSEVLTNEKRTAKKAKLVDHTEANVAPTPVHATPVLKAKEIQPVKATVKTKATSTVKPKPKPKEVAPKVTNIEPKPIRGRKRTIETDNEDEDEPIQKQPKKNAPIEKKDLPILSSTYKLTSIFEGHANINIPAKAINDGEVTDAKDIWCCEFEPPRPGQPPSDIVALCGSYTVLLLNTRQGKYVKKYTHAEIQEIFYCMAWTTLVGEQLLNTEVMEDESCNVLAVAGRLGSIKLLNPLQNECYRYLFGHTQAVLKLAFSKIEPRWLFSASADKTVRLWDIGSPTSKTDDSVCLAKFNLPANTTVPTSLGVSYDLSNVMVGFDNGDMVAFKLSPTLITKFRTKSVSYRQKESTTGDKWRDFGPIATIEPRITYPKGNEWHSGYIDDVQIFGQDGDKKHPLYNKVVSRGSEDMEIILWDPSNSTKTDANILISLEWPDSQDCTGARFKVIEAQGQKVLIAGDYEGQVYIYNVGTMKKSKTLSDNSLEQMRPNRMLSHPMSSELIRDICCSHDTSTIISVDNNNNAFIWCAEENK